MTEHTDPPAPSGLQLDLLTAILRIEQAEAELAKHTAAGADLAEWLIQERLMKCDVPRLRSYLTSETIAWAEAADRAAVTGAGYAPRL